MKKKLLTTVILTAINSTCVSSVMAIINVGFGPQFLPAFCQGFLIGFAVTLLPSYFLPGLLGKLLR